jgi:hypothetical protein
MLGEGRGEGREKLSFKPETHKYFIITISFITFFT